MSSAGAPDKRAALAGQVLQHLPGVLQRLPGCVWVEEVQNGICTQQALLRRKCEARH